MNQKQFEIWEKQKWREYRIDLDKLQNDLAGRGLAYSGIRIKEEDDLKAKYESEIEIKRLEIKEKKQKNNGGMIGILNKGRNNTFIGNTFQNLAVGIQDEGEGTMAQSNVFLSSNENNNLYAEVLEWASSKFKFSEQELFNEFPQLSDSVLKNWYSNIFRGATNNDECLIGAYNDKNGSFYYSLTAKGKSAYSLSKQSPKLNIEKIELVGRDKIEQHEENSKVEINNRQGKESFWSNFFWYFIIALLVVVIGGLILHYGFDIK
ncbi:MAG: hypothetical protein WC297_01990 [Candidatus Paceibacterota bacterium]|jgi:hypothetical protein